MAGPNLLGPPPITLPADLVAAELDAGTPAEDVARRHPTSTDPGGYSWIRLATRS